MGSRRRWLLALLPVTLLAQPDSRRPGTATASPQTVLPRFSADPRRPDAPATTNAKGSNRENDDPIDPYKTGTQKIPTNLVLSKGSTVTIADMLCEIVQWSHDTRSVTCGLSGSQPEYTGVLIVNFTEGLPWSRSVRVEQPTNGGVLAVWGVAVIPVYGTRTIRNVQFSNGGVLATWEQTPEARSVLEGVYAYPTPQATYPPSVKVKEMLCHGSEFLVGKSQAEITPTYSITCVLAGDQQFYAGWLSTWWHQFESRISEQGKPAPIPQVRSTRETANHTQYVRIMQDVGNGTLQYWGVAAMLIQSPVRLGVDRINFYPEREEVTYAPADPTAMYAPQWPPSGDMYGTVPYQPLFPAQPAPPANDWQKSFFGNRWCAPNVSCLRPPG